MNDEVWNDIPGFEGFYKASNKGNIKSVERYVRNGRGLRLIPERNLVQCKTNTGYLQVHLYKNGFKRDCNVHRVIAMTFLAQEEKEVVNHKDGNKQNNDVSNLEWVSAEENYKHAVSLGLCNNHGSNNYKARAVIQADPNGNVIRHWGCINDAQRILKIPQSNIVKCCLGERKTAGGFSWRYLDE